MTRVLVPAGALGLGFDQDALDRGVAMKPDIIAIDGGSTDSGPAYLGRGVSKYSTASTKAEWAKLIDAQQKAHCPLVIGTAGTCGANSTVDWLFEITCEILAERNATAKIVRLYSQQPADRIITALDNGTLTPLTGAPHIDATVIGACSNIVALAGAEQIQAALAVHPDIIIAGRTTDTAIISALPLLNGDNAGAAWHGAKIAECGALCSTHPMSGVVMVDFDTTGFTIEPLSTGAICTPETVSAHMLYENTDPFCLYEPGGYLDVTGAKYIQHTDTAVRVEGSVWTRTDPYTVKFEGARCAGFQTVSIATLRDRRYVENSTAWCADIISRLRHDIAQRTKLNDGEYHIELRQIGRDSTLGALETDHTTPAEVGIMGIITTQTQAQSTEIAKMLNPYLLHHPLTPDEPMPTFAFPFSPPEMERGPIYEFCLNHIMAIQDPMSCFEMVVTHV